jgi:chromate reductase, NAD(P)H dehydrogenase (quinone)
MSATVTLPPTGRGGTITRIPARLLVFAGSTRAGSLNKKLAQAAARMAAVDGAEVTYIDLQDFPMPLYDGDLEAGAGLPEAAVRLRELFRAHDAVLIASPEYNGSFPAVLKNVIDWVSRPWNGEPPLAVLRVKTAGVMSASPGKGGGRRGSKHLRELLEMVGMQVLPQQVNAATAMEAFAESGSLSRQEDRESVRVLTQAAIEQVATKPVAPARL